MDEPQHVNEYWVVWVTGANRLDDLIADVNRLITQGWRPLGGICASPGEASPVWAQTMTR